MEDFISYEQHTTSFRDVEWNLDMDAGQVDEGKTTDSNGELSVTTVFPVAMEKGVTVKRSKMQWHI